MASYHGVLEDAVLVHQGLDERCVLVGHVVVVFLFAEGWDAEGADGEA